MSKILKNVLIFFVVAVLIIGIVAGVVGLIRNSTPTQPNDDSGSVKIAAISDEGKKIYAGGTYSMPDQLTIIAQAPKTGEYSSAGEFIVTVTAPEAPIDSVYDFTWDFMTDTGNGLGLSEADIEKWRGYDASDYISVMPLSSNKARVNYLKSFALPIEIKAQAVGSSAYATCRVDCVAFSLNYLYAWFGEMQAQMDPIYGFIPTPLDFGNTGKIGLYTHYGHASGTVASEYIIRDCTLKLKPEFVERLNNYLSFDISVKEYNAKASIDSNYYRDFGDDGSYKINAHEFEFETLDYSMFIENFKNFSEQQKQAVYYAWYAAFVNSGEVDNFDIQLNHLQITYAGVVLYDYGPEVLSKMSRLISTRGAAVSGERYGKDLSSYEGGV